MHETTRRRISEYLARHDLSQREFAARIGVDQSTLNRFLAGKISDVAFHVVQNIAIEMGVTISWLVDEMPTGPYDLKTIAVLRAMESLPEEKKDALVAVCNAMQDARVQSADQ